MPFKPDDYITLGAGGISFLTLIYFAFYYAKKISPKLDKVNANDTLIIQIVENNNKALSEVSKSNDNVASALNLLRASTDAVHETMHKVDERNERMENGLIKMNERIKFIGRD